MAVNASAQAPVNMADDDSSVREIVIDWKGAPVPQLVAENGADAEDVTLDFHYCDVPANGLFTGDAGEIENSAAIFLPSSIVSRYAGAEIVSVVLCSGVNMDHYSYNDITDATLFLSYDIFGEDPFMTQRARLSRSSRTWSEVSLKTPYKLEADKPLFVGYTVVRPTNRDCPFIADSKPIDSDCSFWINYSLNGERRWENWAPEYGSLCMRVKLRGGNLPVNDAELVSVSVPTQVSKGSFQASFEVKNMAANNITKIGYRCRVGSGEPINRVYTPSTPLEFSESVNVTLSLTCDEYGQDIPVSVEITSVNGVDDTNPSNNQKSAMLLCLDPSMGYERKVVMEEGTGTWCSNCPRGIASMKYMHEKYPERFIGIAAHQNDPMEIRDSLYYPDNSYVAHFMMIGAYPNARFNRTDSYGNNINDFGPHVESIYKSIITMPALAKISADIYFTDDSKTSINVETETEFAIDNSIPCRIALVLLENGVGPHKQENGYAGMPYDCGGWESMSGKAPYVFDEVARYIDKFEGKDGVLPANKTANKQYRYNSVIPAGPLSSLDNFDVVAMLINGKTGVIENAVMCHGDGNLPVKAFDPSAGIGKVETAPMAEVSAVAGGLRINGYYSSAIVYGMNGTVVARATGSDFIELPAGLYIVSVDGAVAGKVRVR